MKLVINQTLVFSSVFHPSHDHPPLAISSALYGHLTDYHPPYPRYLLESRPSSIMRSATCNSSSFGAIRPSSRSCSCCGLKRLYRVDTLYSENRGIIIVSYTIANCCQVHSLKPNFNRLCSLSSFRFCLPENLIYQLRFELFSLILSRASLTPEVLQQASMSVSHLLATLITSFKFFFVTNSIKMIASSNAISLRLPLHFDSTGEVTLILSFRRYLWASFIVYRWSLQLSC